MQAIRNMEPAWEKVNGRKFALVEYHQSAWEKVNGRKFALVEYHQSAWEKISGLKFQLTSRTISQHGRKLLRENFTSVHKIYPLAPCSLLPAPKEAELPKDE